ncbi:hypothetical protein F511_20480 [Dorcoceras hygrometricum]|uniref:Uncharacterized protein n=1 Tax=Dorcoceras hygrometricum TaxID=472368 RepID=A0A2Z7CMC5_9LAMI|nr:hypothetical protein F511_20480 [Dorcoceras hygrometricum]
MGQLLLGQSHDQQRNLGNLKQHTGKKHQPQRTSGSNPGTESSINSIRKATDKYANAMQGINATTESREPKDRNNSSTARSDQRKDNTWPRGILSTWELPTHLQYIVSDAKHTAPPTVLAHEVWELPTPLIAANKPSREKRSLTQLTLTQLPAESSSLIQNAVVPNNPNDDVLAPATESTLGTLYCSATTDLATTAEHNHPATTADVTTAERQHSAMTHANY